MHDPARVSPEELLAAVEAVSGGEGQRFTATLEAQPVAPAADELTPEQRAGLDLVRISRGEQVTLREQLVPGKFTIFDYYADWCGPCKVLGRHLERLLLSRSDVAVRQVDIIDWESAAAKQATREHRMPGLPFLLVYGPDGALLGQVEGNDPDALADLLERRP